MVKKEHHVTYDSGKDMWKVQKVGSDRASGYFDKKQDAVDEARIISTNQKTELVIHKKDGKINKKDSHGNDPYPPRG